MNGFRGPRVGGSSAPVPALVVLVASCVSLTGCQPEPAEDAAGDDRRMGPRMMMGMMENLPRGISPGALPDHNSPDARLVVRYCSQCHGVPSPRRLSASEWPATLDRMFDRMERMSGMGAMGGMMRDLESPGPEERERILGYLQEHALRATTEDALPGAPGAALFARACSRCHALPDPAQRSADEWPGVVARMRENMRDMGVDDITAEQAAEILRYLQQIAPRSSTSD